MQLFALICKLCTTIPKLLSSRNIELSTKTILHDQNEPKDALADITRSLEPKSLWTLICSKPAFLNK